METHHLIRQNVFLTCPHKFPEGFYLFGEESWVRGVDLQIVCPKNNKKKHLFFVDLGLVDKNSVTTYSKTTETIILYDRLLVHCTSTLETNPKLMISGRLSDVDRPLCKIGSKLCNVM